MSYRFEILDVFTDTAFTGNPLAVVFDADDLSDARMQQAAREFNLSETVFVCKAGHDMHTGKLRIFTPVHEIPFAGHPTLGAAVAIAGEAWDGGGEIDRLVLLEENVGPVRVAVVLKPDSPAFAEFDLPKLPESIYRPVPPARIATALGLMPADLGFDEHVPTVFDAGLEYTLVPVRDADALGLCQPDSALCAAAFSADNDGAVFVYTRAGEDDEADFLARMFDPAHGIPEDPATGSAVATLSGALAKFERLRNGHHSFLIAQGREMGRASRIRLELEMAEGELARARVGGQVVAVASGELKA